MVSCTPVCLCCVRSQRAAPTVVCAAGLCADDFISQRFRNLVNDDYKRLVERNKALEAEKVQVGQPAYRHPPDNGRAVCVRCHL